MKFKEFDVVELPRNIPAKGLSAGMRATILDVYLEPPGYEVEVVDHASETVFIGGMSEAQLSTLNATEGDTETPEHAAAPSPGSRSPNDVSSSIEETIVYAKSLLGASPDSPVTWSGERVDGGAIRVWEQARGGRTLFVGDDGSVLKHGSALGRDAGIAQWASGHRTDLDELSGGAPSLFLPVHDDAVRDA